MTYRWRSSRHPGESACWTGYLSSSASCSLLICFIHFLLFSELPHTLPINFNFFAPPNTNIWFCLRWTRVIFFYLLYSIWTPSFRFTWHRTKAWEICYELHLKDKSYKKLAQMISLHFTTYICQVCLTQAANTFIPWIFCVCRERCYPNGFMCIDVNPVY